MSFAPQKHRRSIRLKGHDYSQPGAYFVTICVQGRQCLFGEATGGQMRLNDAGKIVEQCWLSIPEHFPGAELDVFAIMPNHVHGIIVLTNSVGATHASPLQENAFDASPLRGRPHGPQRRSIASVIGSFKSAAAKRINQTRGLPGASVWQRNYYEHVIRNGESLGRIRQYIAENPMHWSSDLENPNRGVRRDPAPTKDEPWRI